MVEAQVWRRSTPRSHKVIGWSFVVWIAMSCAMPSISHGAEPGGPATTDVPTYTADELVVRGQKLSEADRLAASQLDEEGGTIASVCPFSTTCPGDPPPDYVLTMYARQQGLWYYCGPATAQVISNRSWGVYSSSTNGESASTNKYKQTAIADHTELDDGSGGVNVLLRTDGEQMENGVAWAAREPSGFACLYDSSGTKDQLLWKIVIDTYTYKMGLALSVRLTATVKLRSWSSYTGGGASHWVAIRGYTGFGGSSPRIYYTDSSAGLGGSTGQFSDLLTLVHLVNANQSGHVVW